MLWLLNRTTRYISNGIIKQHPQRTAGRNTIKAMPIN